MENLWSTRKACGTLLWGYFPQVSCETLVGYSRATLWWVPQTRCNMMQQCNAKPVGAANHPAPQQRATFKVYSSSTATDSRKRAFHLGRAKAPQRSETHFRRAVCRRCSRRNNVQHNCITRSLVTAERRAAFPPMAQTHANSLSTEAAQRPEAASRTTFGWCFLRRYAVHRCFLRRLLVFSATVATSKSSGSKT